MLVFVLCCVVAGLVGDILALDAKPRELRRPAVKLLATIGEGAFGTVHKALLDESAATGVPEYTVAVKVPCFVLCDAWVSD